MKNQEQSARGGHGDHLYFLGCPVWACRHWTGELFTRHAKREQWLEQYSQVFNAVEGNSTFYGLPDETTLDRWITSSAPGFRFVLKFPQAITHEKRLLDAESETEAFLAVLDKLHSAQRLGPVFLQLPRGIGGHHLDCLADYLQRLPRRFSYAVEVRHLEFFENPTIEKRLNSMLIEMGVDRVIFDSRPLFSSPPADDFEKESQRRKPNLPVCTAITGGHPIVRLVGRNNLTLTLPWVQQWAQRVASWLHDGLQPFVFTHTPDETFAPSFARLFHEELRKHSSLVPEMPAWPGEREEHQQQLELF